MLGPASGSTGHRLAPFVGAHNLFGVGYYGWPVEALSEHIFNQGPRHDMVPIEPAVDITQQLLPLFDGNATLQDNIVASPVELALNNNKGLGTMHELPSLHFVRR